MRGARGDRRALEHRRSVVPPAERRGRPVVEFVAVAGDDKPEVRVRVPGDDEQAHEVNCTGWPPRRSLPAPALLGAIGLARCTPPAEHQSAGLACCPHEQRDDRDQADEGQGNRE